MKKLVLSLLIAAALVFTACGSSQGAKESDEALRKTKEIALLFTTRDLDGNIVDQSIFAEKKVTMINVWATFCGPCLREMPELQVLSEEMAARGVQIIGIVADGTDRNYQERSEILNSAREIVEKAGVTYPSLIPCRALSPLCQIVTVPTTFFFDETGTQIAEPVVGSRNAAQWRAVLERVLEAAA